MFEDVDFDTEDCLEDVRAFLLLVPTNLVEVPVPIMETIKKYMKSKINTLDSSHLRSVLLRHPHLLSGQTFEEKMNLLFYCLLDKAYDKMENIPLVPLDDGSFEAFDCNNKAIFIDSDDHPKILLLPGFKGRFLSQDTPEEIREDLVEAAQESG